MEFKVTLTPTTQFPNNNGELSFFNLYKTPEILEYSTATGYHLVPEIWIGEKGLWNVPNYRKIREHYKDLDRHYLLVETSLIGDMSIEDAVGAGKAKELTLDEALSVIQDAIKLNYVASTSSELNELEVKNIKRRNMNLRIRNLE